MYAWFGATALDVSNLEQDFLIILLLLAHLDDPHVTEEALVARDASLDDRTMGQMLRQVRDRLGLPEVTCSLLAEAVGRRNYLFHHFWREQGERLASREGCMTLCQELQGLSGAFRTALGHTSGIMQALAGIAEIPLETAAADAARLWKHSAE